MLPFQWLVRARRLASPWVARLFRAGAWVTGSFVRACPRGSSDRALFEPTGNQNLTKRKDKRQGWGKHGLFKYDHMGIRWIFFHQDWNSHVSVELAQRLVFPSFENERKQVKSSLSAVQPTEILGYDSSTWFTGKCCGKSLLAFTCVTCITAMMVYLQCERNTATQLMHNHAVEFPKEGIYCS